MADPSRGMDEKGSEAEAYFGRDLEAMSNAVNYRSWVLEEFSPFLGRSGAEVGAGSGSFSEVLATSGLSRLVACEPSPNMYELLERRFRDDAVVETRQARLTEIAHLYREQFDSVVYVNVLEHVEDDLGELRTARQTLAPGGHLLLFVPAHQALYSRFDRECGHFRRYGRKELEQVVQRAGFAIRKAKYLDLPGAFLWYLFFVLLKGPLTGGRVLAYDRLAIPTIRRLENVIHPPFGKNLLLVAEKKRNND